MNCASQMDLPSGWHRCALPDFTRIVMGQSPSSETYNLSGLGIPFFQGKGEFGRVYPKIRLYCSQPKKIAKQGATLLSVRAPVGPTNLAQQECCIGRGLAAIHPCGGIAPEFVLYMIRNVEPQLSREGTGSTFGAISRRAVESMEFDLPPLSEQKRILAKIDELFSELDQGIECLKKGRAQLETYRQAVLKHAFEGKVTTQWRAANRDQLETAEGLLGGIIRAQVKRYDEQLRGWTNAVNDWNDGARVACRHTRPAPLRTISTVPESETDSFPTLPAGWTYVRLGFLIDEPKYGTSRKCGYDYRGTGVLRIPNVVDGVINVDDLKGAHFDDDEVRFPW